jgi:hypothetical protein
MPSASELFRPASTATCATTDSQYAQASYGDINTDLTDCLSGFAHVCQGLAHLRRIEKACLNKHLATLYRGKAACMWHLEGKHLMRSQGVAWLLNHCLRSHDHEPVVQQLRCVLQQTLWQIAKHGRLCELLRGNWELTCTLIHSCFSFCSICKACPEPSAKSISVASMSLFHLIAALTSVY